MCEHVVCKSFSHRTPRGLSFIACRGRLLPQHYPPAESLRCPTNDRHETTANFSADTTAWTVADRNGEANQWQRDNNKNKLDISNDCLATTTNSSSSSEGAIIMRDDRRDFCYKRTQQFAIGGSDSWSASSLRTTRISSPAVLWCFK